MKLGAKHVIRCQKGIFKIHHLALILKIKILCQQFSKACFFNVMKSTYPNAESLKKLALGWEYILYNMNK